MHLDSHSCNKIAYLYLMLTPDGQKNLANKQDIKSLLTINEAVHISKCV